MTHSEPSLPIQRLVADIDAAARRAEHQVRARSWRIKAPLAVLGALATSTAVATATGSLGIFETTSSYKITEHAATDTPTGRICLDLQLADPNRRGMFGCGEAPSAAQPFGILTVVAEAGAESIAFGLVAQNIVTVRIAGRDVDTGPRPGLPGRFFSFKVLDRPSVYAEGLSNTGAVVATIGSRIPSTARVDNNEQARAQGDLLGFAPGAAEAPFTFDGRTISPEQAQERNLICTEDDTPTITCTAR